MKIIKLAILTLGLLLLFTSCDEGEVNFFSLQDDIDFGRQLDAEIAANPGEYPLLPRTGNENLYNYVEGIMLRVLDSDNVRYRNKFPWRVKIIDKDVQNAFAAPGGSLYFYTGFLTFAESEAELAGVMAHEIAHADRRHSTENMTKLYGIQILFSIILGEDPSTLGTILAQLTGSLSGLSFSRENEFEADEYAVRYMDSIRGGSRNYNLLAMQDFFNRMEDVYEVDGDGSPVGEFFRTHPYNNDRENAMTAVWDELGRPSGELYTSNHTSATSGY
jgi:predicted Zn-dependent protease